MAKITIFGLAGVGKSTTGKILAQKLGYDYISTGKVFRKMAEDNNMTLVEFEHFSENDPKYDKQVDEVFVKEYSRNNSNFVLDSRLAWYFIPDSIKIRLFCDDQERIRRVAERENKDYETAKRETMDREGVIFEKYKKLYGLDDITNPNNFDLNVDTSKDGIDGVVNNILDYLKGKI